MSAAAPHSAAPPELARAAETALDGVLDASHEDLPATIPEAVRCLVRLRDNLIARQRSGEPAPAGWLPRTNAILSCVVGAEFPIAGLHRERVETALGAVREMLATKEP